MSERKLRKWKKRFEGFDEVFAIACLDSDSETILSWVGSHKLEIGSEEAARDETSRRLWTDARKAQDFYRKIDHKQANALGYRLTIATLAPPRIKSPVNEPLPLSLFTPPAGNGFVILLPEKKGRKTRYWGQLIRGTYRTFDSEKAAKAMRKRLEDSVYIKGSLRVELSPLSTVVPSLATEHLLLIAKAEAIPDSPDSDDTIELADSTQNVVLETETSDGDSL